MDGDPASQVPSADVPNISGSQIFSTGAKGNSARQHEEQFENLPEEPQIIKASDDAGFIRNVSPGQLSVTIDDFHLEGCGLLRNDNRSNPQHGY